MAAAAEVVVVEFNVDKSDGIPPTVPGKKCVFKGKRHPEVFSFLANYL